MLNLTIHLAKTLQDNVGIENELCNFILHCYHSPTRDDVSYFRFMKDKRKVLELSNKKRDFEIVQEIKQTKTKVLNLFSKGYDKRTQISQ